MRKLAEILSAHSGDRGISTRTTKKLSGTSFQHEKAERGIKGENYSKRTTPGADLAERDSRSKKGSCLVRGFEFGFGSSTRQVSRREATMFPGIGPVLYPVRFTATVERLADAGGQGTATTGWMPSTGGPSPGDRCRHRSFVGGFAMASAPMAWRASSVPCV